MGETRDVPKPMAAISTVSPCMSCLAVVRTAPAADDSHQTEDHASYGTVHGDWCAAAGLERRERE